MKKSGFAPVLIILVIAILGVVGYFVYKNFHLETILSLTISVPSASPGVIANLPVELMNVPIYPNVKYDPKYGQESFYSSSYCGDKILCKVTQYAFSTTESSNTLLSWYKTSGRNSWNFVVLFTDQDSFEGTLSLNNTNYTVKVSPGFQGQSFGQLNELDVIKSGSSFNWPVANQVEISSWITFTEKDNMFTFKYPKDLFVKEGSSIYEAPFATACPSCLGQSAFGIAVTISPNVNNLSSEAYAAKIEKIDQPNAVFIKNKPSYFGGLDVTIADGLNGGGNPGPNVFIAKNGKIIEFETEGVGVEQLNKIFSTLKFLN